MSELEFYVVAIWLALLGLGWLVLSTRNGGGRWLP